MSSSSASSTLNDEMKALTELMPSFAEFYVHERSSGTSHYQNTALTVGATTGSFSTVINNSDVMSFVIMTVALTMVAVQSIVLYWTIACYLLDPGHFGYIMIILLTATLSVLLLLLLWWIGNNTSLWVPILEEQLDEEDTTELIADTLKSVPPLYYSREMICDSRCVICITQMVEGDAVRVLTCQHGFHSACLDEWLLWRQVCPLCVSGVKVV
jgi:hypothetical protein